jgi:hypothetical protein
MTVLEYIHFTGMFPTFDFVPSPSAGTSILHTTRRLIPFAKVLPPVQHDRDVLSQT